VTGIVGCAGLLPTPGGRSAPQRPAWPTRETLIAAGTGGCCPSLKRQRQPPVAARFRAFRHLPVACRAPPGPIFYRPGLSTGFPPGPARASSSPPSRRRSFRGLARADLARRRLRDATSPSHQPGTACGRKITSTFRPRLMNKGWKVSRHPDYLKFWPPNYDAHRDRHPIQSIIHSDGGESPIPLGARAARLARYEIAACIYCLSCRSACPPPGAASTHRRGPAQLPRHPTRANTPCIGLALRRRPQAAGHHAAVMECGQTSSCRPVSFDERVHFSISRA